MGIKMSKESDNCIVISVSDVLSYPELQSVQESAKRILNTGTKVNCPILADAFRGWGKGGDWGDLTFMYASDPYIGKIALVSDEGRKDDLLMFLGAGRRQAEVRHFYPYEEQDARDWLAGIVDV